MVIAASIRQLGGVAAIYDCGLLRAVMAITKMRFRPLWPSKTGLAGRLSRPDRGESFERVDEAGAKVSTIEPL
jgi:hypothetical protein